MLTEDVENLVEREVAGSQGHVLRRRKRSERSHEGYDFICREVSLRL